MSVLDRILDSFKFVDKNGLKKIAQLTEKKIWRGKTEDWYAMSQAERDKYDNAVLDDEVYVIDSDILIAKNLTIAVSDWVADTTYADFGFKAEIAMAGVTEEFSPDVRLKYIDIKDGIIGPVAEAFENKVVIYASAKPSTDILIPVIICTYMG